MHIEKQVPIHGVDRSQFPQESHCLMSGMTFPSNW
uniref:Uncharacterized protein n=1 Tax=Anguilla anguilla TaxID=7936 RepID=A0A0E9WF72_ANGAN